MPAGRKEHIMAIRYQKFNPTEYVFAVKGGRTVREGAGISCLYSTLRTSLMVVPMTESAVSFAYDDILTADFQRINVQGDAAYVIENYASAAGLLDFSYGNSRKAYETAKLLAEQTIEKRVVSQMKARAMRFFRDLTIHEAVGAGTELADVLTASLREDEALMSLGIRLLSVTVLGISPQPDMRKALEAATREEILRQQDDALYSRRNAAIEQERAIKENELNTEIRAAEKEKERREKQMETEKMLQERKSEMARRKMEDSIALEEKNRSLVELQTENERQRADSRIYETQAILTLLAGLDPELVRALAMSSMDSGKLIAQAFTDIGKGAEKIGTLNITPDLLDSLVK